MRFDEKICNELFDLSIEKVSEIKDFIYMKTEITEERLEYIGNSISWIISIFTASIKNEELRNEFIDTICNGAKEISPEIRKRYLTNKD